MNQPTLADQLRSDLSIAERRRDDAAQLAIALNVGAQLADQVTNLTAERDELRAQVISLQKELLGEVTDGDPNPTAEPYGSADHQ